eukprot:1945914-Amphidinium_carterae.1
MRVTGWQPAPLRQSPLSTVPVSRPQASRDLLSHLAPHDSFVTTRLFFSLRRCCISLAKVAPVSLCEVAVLVVCPRSLSEEGWQE